MIEILSFQQNNVCYMVSLHPVRSLDQTTSHGVILEFKLSIGLAKANCLCD